MTWVISLAMTKWFPFHSRATESTKNLSITFLRFIDTWTLYISEKNYIANKTFTSYHIHILCRIWKTYMQCSFNFARNWQNWLKRSKSCKNLNNKPNNFRIKPEMYKWYIALKITRTVAMEHRRWPWAVHAPILTIYHLWGQFKHFRSVQSCPFTDSACIICDSNTTLLKCLKTTPVHQTPRDQSNPKWIIHKYVNLSFNWPIGEYRSVISRGISTITLGSLGFFLPNNDRNKNAEKSSKYICLNVMSIVSLTFDWTKTIVINTKYLYDLIVGHWMQYHCLSTGLLKVF